MKLSSLDRFDNIVIQMHDNPDADAIGSGYSLYKYFESKGKKVRLIYGGKLKITKSNIVLLIERLQLPVEYVTELEKPELLITVDCQYGEGNVQKFEGENIAIIDHHNTGRISDDMAEIRSHIVSCSTICYDMLKKEGFDINGDISVATSLYYGLFMDSNGFSEIRHPLERDMIDFLRVDKGLIKKLVHSNFTIQELETAGIALIRYSYDENRHLSIIKSKPCDPNILGLIGDLVLQVDSIDVCVIYNECPGGYKLSVRSCVVEVAANDLAIYITDGIGNGGGHNDKAGGYISEASYRKVYDNLGIESYFFERVNQYYRSFDVIYAKEGIDDNAGFTLYKKNKLVCGYVKTTDFLAKGTECKVRTYEGDVFITASDDIYLMIGYNGEVYPIEKEVFERKYDMVEGNFNKEFEYAPSIRNLHNDEIYELMPYANKCICKDSAKIYAKQLLKAAKVFTKWDYEKYMMGSIGDYICYTANDEKDIYIINKEIFKETYSICK